MRATLQHVATRLGLNRSTVSRALRHDPRISKETRLRVEAVSKEMGYRPNAMLSELATSRWNSEKVEAGSVIAYISCNPEGDDAWMHLMPAMRQQAATLGYQLEPFRRRNFTSSARLERMLRNRGITDVIVGPMFDEENSVQLDWEKVIGIQLLPSFHQLPLHSVVKDHFNSVVVAWQQAVSHGYRRIGVILYQHTLKLADDFLRAGAVASCQTVLSPELPALPPFYFGPDGARPAEFKRWVEKHSPDVLIGFTEDHFFVYRSQFQRDPPYISLHRLDGSWFAGIGDSLEACAKEGINLLHYCRRSYQWGIPPQRIDHLIEPTWFEGESLPAKN